MLRPSDDLCAFLMQEALAEARQAQLKAEVPIGAVAYHENRVIARAHNLTESLQDPTAHAEILLLRQAAQSRQNWRLNEVIVCVTLEPCTMCIGALWLARVAAIVYGAADARAGSIGLISDLSFKRKLGIAPEVVQGVCADECSNLLKTFFARRRQESS